MTEDNFEEKRFHPSMTEIYLLSPEAEGLTSPLQQFTLQEVQSAGGEGGAFTERGIPRAVTFAWEGMANTHPSVRYELAVGQSPDLQQAWIRSGLERTSIEVANLQIGATYFWRVTAYAGIIPVAQSLVGTFFTHPATPRWICVPGVSNVRDIGGWALPDGRRIRQGMLYRGSEMNDHCTISEAGRKVLVEDLGIRTDIDLRGVDEACQSVLDLRRVRYINLPIAGYDMIVDTKYTEYFRTLFCLLADPAAYPVYMHCWGGADRTGTAVFLLQALLGMQAEDLATEYELTSLSLMGERLSTSEAYQDLLMILSLFDAQGHTLQSQVEHYLRVIGVGDAEINAIRGLMIV